MRRWALWLLAAACALLLFVGGPASNDPRSWRELWNLGHILAFALWGGLWLRWRGGGLSWNNFKLALLLTLLIGGGIELLQGGLGRSPDLVDLGRDLVGTLLALAWARPSSWPPGRQLLLRTAALLLGLLCLLPPKIALTDEALARRDFPVLANFETPFELDRWEGNAQLSIASNPVARGGNSLRAVLGTERYAGLFLTAFPRDWRGHRTLVVEMHNPLSQPLRLVCRIHDRAHTVSEQAYDDRFNRGLLLAPGWNHLRIDLAEVAAAPKGRALDLGQVAGVGFFAIELPEPVVLHLDALRLEP